MTKPPTVPKYGKPVFAVILTDDPDKTHIRDELHAEHLKFIEENFDKYVLAGPLRMGGEEKPSRSLVMLTAATEEEARAAAEQDPYAKAGLYKSIETGAFIPAAGDLLGGIIW